MEKNNLELGKYMESDLIALTDETVDGGTTPATPATPVIVAVSAYVSDKTCQTTACTRAC